MFGILVINVKFPFVIHAEQRVAITLTSHMSSLITSLSVHLPPLQLHHIYEKFPEDA